MGGGGSNAVNYMFNLGIEGVDFIVCNTDSQALALSPVPNKIQLGPHLTQGLGAGANPEVGMKASEESLEDITKILKVNTRMAFITAGMGGGTGTGGAPVVAKICRELGILTVGIVTMPFTYEGRKRMKQAQEGIDRMREHVDTVLIISNDKLRQQFGNLPFTQAFAKADDILATAAKCITDVITTTGSINVDFADVCTVMRSGGVAILGNATAAGENRAYKAVEEALSSPLLNDNDIQGAKWILLNITSAAGEFEHTMDEAEAIQAFVQTQAGDNCDVILGMGHDQSLNEKIAVTIIATGFHHKDIPAQVVEKKNEPAKILVSLGETKADEKMNVTTTFPTDRSADRMNPTLVEMPAVKSYTSIDPVPAATPVFVADSSNEKKEVYNLQMFSAPVAEEKTEEALPEPEPQPVAQTQVLVQVPAEVKADDIQLVIKNEQLQAPSTSPTDEIELKIGDHVLTPFELEEKRRFEDQKRALEERAERLRKLSFNIKGGDSPDEIENVPAYVRKNINVEEGMKSSDTFYSGYTIGFDNEPNSKQASIQTINTFLDGKKPD